MTSTCTIRAKSSGRTTNPTTGAVVKTPGAVIYSGPCRLKSAGTQGQTTEAGAAELFTYDFSLDVPFSATGIRAGQRATIDASPDPDAVGLEIEIQRPYPGDQVIRRRLLCTDVA